MLPRDLKSEQFAGYPPEARKIVVHYLATLRQLPLSFLPGLLRELIDYDFEFPAERRARESELTVLANLSPAQFKDWFQSFEQIQISSQLEKFDWVNSPAQFVEQLSAHLWTTHQLDAFRKASSAYGEQIASAIPPERPPIPRLGITVIGEGVDSYHEPLFRKLRPHGAYYTRINPENGLRQLLDAVSARARTHPARYYHWYIDGGDPAPHDSSLTLVSYSALEPVRSALLKKVRVQLETPGMGPEALRTTMARIRPSDLFPLRADQPADEILDRFQVKLLTEGSGTQIFSTSFTQWAAREALRRAQPLTLLVRFAPRQRQKDMNELLSGAVDRPELDPVGSLIDGDMGAYYNWMNQQRLPGAAQSAFLVWFEGHSLALAIGPGTPRGTESNSPADLSQVLAWNV